ncbi:adaptor protein [Apilactobacillus ozensis DSM 23829 = JCM 17196]|uniref:Adapter protein MecA n=1 Tax=Apilactobacillus ozensis DSM 23829 = JCM 17196 TaxID=1423781 RepID=A0A0R2APQ3_9LACO|nr:adaptor protein MecA [Apilactobacillus ozensis]KRM68618.1 adaptor protein [Apilactobacillus ozensis DSM 23829 = JCM 17196]
MEMERINEDTIRVLINNSDLDERGITVLDLLGNRKQIEGFFYSILEEVDSEHQFQQDGSVTFQVLPNKNGLELFISKGEHIDQDDSFSNSTTIDNNDIKNADNYSLNNNDDAYTRNFIIKFNSFEDFISLSKVLRIENGASNLYFYKSKYFLELTFFVNVGGTDEESIKDSLAIAYEYGNKFDKNSRFFDEHGKRIMDTGALELARYYFK